MLDGLFATTRRRRAWLAIVAAKIAAVVAVLFMLGAANASFSLGIPVLLLHVGALAVIAALIWQGAHGSMATKRSRPASNGVKAPHLGILLHSAVLYDMLVWLLTFGRERAFRERILNFAELKPGEAVLDIGCGTGTIALLAKEKVGPAGRVHGVDPSAEMVARAAAKARRAGLEVTFSNATAQQLNYKDREFDVVLSTLMLHHLPKSGRTRFGAEAFRVLKPGGRLLIVDFAKPPRRKRILRFHRHGHTDLDKVAVDLGQWGFEIVKIGDVGSKRLRYLVARREVGTTSSTATG